jgi:SAM-dependent methyltransferase
MSRMHRQRVAAYFASTVSLWEEFYDCRAAFDRDPVYTSIYRSRLSIALSLVEALKLGKDARCLDIGCGPGFGTVALAQFGLAVDAMDIVEAQLLRMRSRTKEADVAARVTACVCDIHDLAYKADLFDLVFVVGVMEWLEAPDGPLREIASVLKPGGYAVISVDNKWALARILNPGVSPLRPPIWRWVRRFFQSRKLAREPPPTVRDFAHSIRSFDQRMLAAGLQKMKGVTVGFGPFSLWKLHLPSALGLPLHRMLQRWADRKLYLLRSAGFVYLTVAQKTDRADLR